ncbi:MAG TPA: glycine betaine ABC transporter substrate-binding protein [Ktedonobacterales bacterium]|nr:glycine betaine ABC transporter substrate-binding protein [Ktedonobacterales bacterium]
MRSNRVVYKLLGVVMLLAVLVIAGCGGGGSGAGNGSTNKGNITVGSKNDPDSQLLGTMYALLLQHAGYTVTTKIPLGQTPVLDAAIKSGSIDVYPEFTGTSLTVYKLPATQNPQQAYQSVASYYEQNFKLTWLDPAYNLNDSYAICTSPQVAQQRNLKSLDDLVPIASQLTIATQQDGVAAAIDPVQTTYSLHFKAQKTVTEPLGFDAVKTGQADLNVCYTTDPAIVTNNFVVLTDSKGVFPIYNPAPVVRDSVLSSHPDIKTVLNPLETKLTTDEIVKLIKQKEVDHQPVRQVAQTWLQQQGLLS